MKKLTAIMAASALIGVSACRVNVNEEDNAAAQENEAAVQQQQTQQQQQTPQVDPRIQQMRDQARQEIQNMNVVVDISDRQLRVLSGDRVVHTAPVAVGTEEWPTPTGSWEFHRVDINPEWIPPEEEWAEEEERAAPGDPENPMGRARLVYRMPNTVHGTDDLDSLGKASSHGSIRVANEVVLKLAEMLLKSGGAWEGPQWFQQMVQNRSEEYQVNMPERVPILVQE